MSKGEGRLNRQRRNGARPIGAETGARTATAQPLAHASGYYETAEPYQFAPAKLVVYERQLYRNSITIILPLVILPLTILPRSPLRTLPNYSPNPSSDSARLMRLKYCSIARRYRSGGSFPRPCRSSSSSFDASVIPVDLWPLPPLRFLGVRSPS